LSLFSLGCLLSLFAPTFTVMLLGRLLQGLGAAGPRIVTVAIVRDQYEGQTMAQVMSFVMAVFILVPVVAPALGQGILLLAHWRALFGIYLGLALISALWFGLRQPETLALQRRIPFSFGRIGRAIAEIFANRQALGYTLTAGLVMGAFLGYLNSAQQIFQEEYGLGRLFPFYFSGLAIALGCAFLLNTRLVMRYGMRPLIRGSLVVVAGLSLLFWAITYPMAGQPPLWLLMSYFLISFFGIGLLFGNMNALAMEPLGHIAGIGAAVVGSLSTFMALLLGGFIGQSYDGSVLPLITGFALLSSAALLVMFWTEAKKPAAQYGSISSD
jgi:DHA1 family bicyclomycin/chloramphenicol resistance-like MFS transporter